MCPNWLLKLKEEIMKQVLGAAASRRCPKEMKFVCFFAAEMKSLMMKAALKQSEDILLDCPSRLTESRTKLSRVPVRQQPGAVELWQLAFKCDSELVLVSLVC